MTRYVASELEMSGLKEFVEVVAKNGRKFSFLESSKLYAVFGKRRLYYILPNPQKHALYIIRDYDRDSTDVWDYLGLLEVPLDDVIEFKSCKTNRTESFKFNDITNDKIFQKSFFAAFESYRLGVYMNFLAKDILRKPKLRAHMFVVNDPSVEYFEVKAGPGMPSTKLRVFHHDGKDKGGLDLYRGRGIAVWGDYGVFRNSGNIVAKDFVAYVQTGFVLSKFLIGGCDYVVVDLNKVLQDDAMFQEYKNDIAISLLHYAMNAIRECESPVILISGDFYKDDTRLKALKVPGFSDYENIRYSINPKEWRNILDKANELRRRNREVWGFLHEQYTMWEYPDFLKLYLEHYKVEYCEKNPVIEIDLTPPPFKIEIIS